jgi:KaiC/GvpD/RAD55 family RecA-like ATPase
VGIEVAATLIIVNVEKIQDEINRVITLNRAEPIIFVSLNKTHESLGKIFIEKGIDSSKVFVIDCVANEQKSEEVLIVKPTELDKLSFIINSFIKEIKGKKILVVDALSTLLIYNNENKVAQFVKGVTEFASEKDVDVIALSPKTEGEELLNKIFNFFSKVEKK